MKQELEEEIYFGNKFVNMYPCTGRFFDYDSKKIIQDEINENSTKIALKFEDDLSYIKPEYKDYYVPCVPETLISYNYSLETKNDIDILKEPLIKFKKIDNYNPTYKAIISGHRSAILKDEKNKCYYRLKGCGNDELGFNLIHNKGYFVEHITRGHQFDCTVCRELYYSEKVNSVLVNDTNGRFKCCNLPIGFWKYSDDLNILNFNESKPENQVPEINKYCGIFKTLGDKRLRTHLMGGIEILLRIIANICINKYKFNDKNLEELTSVFPKERIEKKQIPTNILIKPFDATLKEEDFIEDRCLKPIFEEKHYNDLVKSKDLKDTKNKSIQTYINSCNEIDEIFTNLIENKNLKFSDKQKELLKMLFKELAEKKGDNNIFNTIMLMYNRIGYEAGVVKKVLLLNKINWGSFIDHGPYNFHCNAHANNLVVLPQGNDTLLAPLDFDLAFGRDKMINIYNETNTFGQHDLSFWKNYLNCEIFELPNNICGANDYNFDFYNPEQDKHDSLEEKIRDVFKYFLLDGLLNYYMKAFDKLIDFKQNDEFLLNDTELKTNDCLHTLVKISLVITSEDIA